MIDIRIGDCRKILGELESESIQTIVTSPPYWGIVELGELGGEAMIDVELL